MRQAGDPSADALIDELARTEQIRAVSRILRHLVDNDQPLPDDVPPSLAEWLERTAEVPAWADHERLERGCTVVVEHGPQVCVALATASLVYCYAGYPGVKVLTFSRRLDHDAVRRVGETAQFVLAVMAPGSLHPGGRGIRKIQKVRLLHAAIRQLVTRSGRWSSETDGLPLCQEDLVGTLMSFSWIVVDSLRRLGVRVEDQEAEDYHYRWRVIGEMLGIDPAVIPVDLTGARELTDSIARRNHRRSPEGIEMTRALFELHANSLPPGFERCGAGAHAPPARRRDLLARRPPAHALGQRPVLAGRGRAGARPRAVGARAARLADQDGGRRNAEPARHRDGRRPQRQLLDPGPPRAPAAMGGERDLPEHAEHRPRAHPARARPSAE